LHPKLINEVESFTHSHTHIHIGIETHDVHKDMAASRVVFGD